MGGASTNYRLIIGDGRGVNNFATHINRKRMDFDAMATHNGHAFTTRDRDHDAWDDHNCVQVFGGGWWYRACHHANLNGKYLPHIPENFSGSPYDPHSTILSWYDGHVHNRFTRVEMKIRPKRCTSSFKKITLCNF